MKNRASGDVLRAIPLGGHGEIGKNSWLFEYKDEIIIVDFGMMLPGNDLSGVDLVLPSANYLADNQEKIKGLILTSACDETCGGVFYLLEKVKIPYVWGSKLAIENVKLQLSKKIKMPDYEYLEPRKVFQVGSGFSIKPIQNTSIVPDSFGLFIQTSSGNVLYTSSFKVDQTPLDNALLDYFSYSQAGEDGVDLLISDSSNIESPGFTQSECFITKRFKELIKEMQSKLIIFSYASNIHKFQIIFNLVQKNNKRILLSGDYLKMKVEAAINAGMLNVDNKLFVDEKEIDKVKDNELVILASGKYGNFLSALIEVAKQEHPLIKLKPKDVIVVSADPPPGTARILAHTIDQLFVQKVQVVGGKGQGVHVLGHAACEETKFMLTVSKPRSFVPSHGEERHLVLYGNIAESININSNDIHILKNGDVLELREQVARVANKIPAQSIYYNQAKGLDIDEITMKERQTLSEEGSITIALAFDNERNIVAGPEIFAEGCSFAKGKDWRAFCLGAVELVKDAIKQSLARDEKELLSLKSIVRDTVNKSVLELVGRRPLINVSIQEIQETISSKSL